MDSDTGWGSVFGAATNAATSYWNSEQSANAAKLSAKNQLALAGQQTAAQKTVLVVGVLAVVLVVLAVIFARRR